MFRKRLIATTFCTILVCLGATVRLESASESGWFLSQKSGISGDFDLYIGPQSILLNKRTGGLRIYSRAPAWKVLVLNDKSHLFIETTSQDFSGDPKTKLFQAHRQAMRSGQWQKSGADRYAGRDIAKYKMRYKGEFAEDLSFSKKRRSGNRSADYGELVGATLPMPELLLLRKVYVLPDAFSGLPVWLDLSGDGKDALLTMKIDSCRDVPQLKPPAKYKRARSIEEVYQDSQSNALMDSLTNWLGPSTSQDGKAEPPVAHPH